MTDLELQRLEAVADAARVLRQRLRELPDDALWALWGIGLPESAFTQLSSTLDDLDAWRDL